MINITTEMIPSYCFQIQGDWAMFILGMIGAVLLWLTLKAVFFRGSME